MGAFLAFLLLVALGPLALIWSVNTLFALSIPYSVETWLAVLVLSIFASGGSSGRSTAGD